MEFLCEVFEQIENKKHRIATMFLSYLKYLVLLVDKLPIYTFIVLNLLARGYNSFPLE